MDGAAFPCGQCGPCRFNRRRTWANRIMLERLCHADAAFVTLTYKYAPAIDGNLVLWRKDAQDWLKRFRLAVAPKRIRFFLVGEYGDRTERPHYHAIIFGFPTCLRGRTKRAVGSSVPDWQNCCPVCQVYGDTWARGIVDVGGVSSKSASYVASYTVKKMTAPDDIRLRGRTPEFCSMSLRPGIGADAMWDVASKLLEVDYDGLDVPTGLSVGTRPMPLGRYLRRKLRVMLGRDVNAPPEVLEGFKEELRPLRQAAFDGSRSFAKEVSSAGDGAVANIEARNAIYKKRSSI